MKDEYILNVENLKGNFDWTIPRDLMTLHAVQTGFNPCIAVNKTTIDKINSINQSINTNEKEDDRMKSKTMKNLNDGAKNRMGVFREGVSFDTPSGTSPYIIPQITDVKVINKRVVIIKFDDGTQEKTVLSSEDTFSLEQGISICITKKILSQFTYGNGSSAYNKLIDYAMKVYNKNEKEKKAIEEVKEKVKEKAQKYKEKRNKRKAKQRNEQIEILSEAISRAMANFDFDITVDDSNNDEILF